MSLLKRLRMPHPVVLLLGGVALAAALTWVLPAGQFERSIDPNTGREVVLAGTFTTMESAPLGLLAALMAVPRGLVSGADIVIVILFVGGAFVLLDESGALARLIGALVRHVPHPASVVVMVSLLFATLGALVNLYEEVIAMVPVLLLLSRRIGFGAITALSISVGAATVGAAFGPTNPFGAGLAMHYAGIPPMTTIGLRMILLVVAVGAWITWTLLQAKQDDVLPDLDDDDAEEAATLRDGLLLAIALVPFGIYVYGVLQFDWGFNELSALFLVAGYSIGLVAGLGITGTTVRYLKGMESMLVAGLLVGLARGISVALTDGRIIDTIVYGLSSPLQNLPQASAAALMIPIHAILHVPVPSNSGHAVLTMPIFAPTADVLGIPRNVAVMAYQAGGITMDLLTPTSGALLAMLVAARVPYARWIRFAAPGVVLLAIIGLVGMLFAL